MVNFNYIIMIYGRYIYNFILFIILFIFIILIFYLYKQNFQDIVENILEMALVDVGGSIESLEKVQFIYSFNNNNYYYYDYYKY